LLGNVAARILVPASNGSEGTKMVRVKSSQKVFTEEEVTTLTGICAEHLRGLAQNKHLGTLAAGAGKLIFSHSDLMIVNLLQPRCEH
jgi:hypothetical protein